ncbi:hypothetical protein RvY_08792 [Ramazzottius varieornatus]|uniref:Ketoreductase domain-containing protein n=1 Tax=Ramazzottius varieornatus TaxID=947166 RepID=A0A1D1V9C2_RAMVA|nr:hypothetical protein RvY_08792 [Ramazzottius varieornatus]
MESLDPLSWSWRSIFVGIVGSSVVLWGVYKATRSRRRLKLQLSDKVVCVTGATGGLGLALSRTLAAQGARLVLTGRNMDALRRLSFDLSEIYPQIHAPVLVELDLADLAVLESKAKEILNAFGHVDVIIHNAGVSSRGSVMDNSFSVDFEVMKINYLAPVALTKEILPAMIKQGGGTIAVVSSVQGRIAIPERSSYAASKHAIQAYFDALRAEVHEQNISVLVVSPGYIRTNLSLNALTGQGKIYGKMDETTARGMDPMEVADRIIRAVETREEELLICDIKTQFAIYLRTLRPSFYFKLMSKRAAKNKTDKR